MNKFKWKELMRKYGDIEANSYDNSHLKIATSGLYVEQRRREIILPMINKNINGKLLDVACGTGYYLQLLSNNCECVGSDISKRMIEQCRKKGLKNVLVADYEALPFGNNSFDIILCINAIHYTKNPEKVLHEINRVLKEDGVIILTYFNLLNPRAIVHFVRDIFGIKVNIEQRYTIFTIEKMLNKAGLEVIESYACNFYLIPWMVKNEMKRC